MRTELSGIPISDGIAVANTYFLQRKTRTVEKVLVAKWDYEWEKVNDAVLQASSCTNRQVEKLVAQGHTHEAEIFSAHGMVLEDSSVSDKIKAYLEAEKCNAAYAVEMVYQEYIAFFQGLGDSFGERAADFKDVKNLLLSFLTGTEEYPAADFPNETILLLNELIPSEIASLDFNHIKGVITCVGGKNCHAAILARMYNLPVVSGIDGVDEIENGIPLILNGKTGSIVLNPSLDEINAAKEDAVKETRFNEIIQQEKNFPSETRDGTNVMIMGNISGPEEAASAYKMGAQGIGLFRSEFLYMNRDTVPGEEEQFIFYRDAVLEMKGFPVTIRTMDIGGDKKADYLQVPVEDNPFLGFRAIRISLRRHQLFHAQLRAILRCSAFGPVKIMLPMISCCEEVLEAKSSFEACKENLRQQGIEFDENICLGIMVETPAAVFMADQLADLVDFFSIGTNDLIQYTVAADRMNTNVAQLYHEYHPSVLRAISHVIACGVKSGIEVCICGEMAANEKLTAALFGMGLRNFSVSGNSVAKIKYLIRRINDNEAKELAKRMLQCRTAEEVKLQ